MGNKRKKGTSPKQILHQKRYAKIIVKKIKVMNNHYSEGFGSKKYVDYADWGKGVEFGTETHHRLYNESLRGHAHSVT